MALGIKLSQLRLFIAAALPFSVAVWLSVPALQPQERTIEGQARTVSVCPVTCVDLLEIGNVTLACTHDFSGYPHSCRRRDLVDGQARVTYVPLPSVARIFGLSPTAGVVTGIEKDNEIVFRKSISDHVWSALYGGWVFHAIYWPVVLLVGWLWPRSWLARRREQQARRDE